MFMKKVFNSAESILKALLSFSPELSDVVFCNMTNATQEAMEREAYEILKAVEGVYKEVKIKSPVSAEERDRADIGFTPKINFTIAQCSEKRTKDE